MKQTKEPIWVVNVGEATTTGVYRGVRVKIKNIITHQEIYFDDQFHSNAETQSPVKAVKIAMAAIDKQLSL